MSRPGNMTASSPTGIKVIDAAGIGVSSLCLIHCLALPMLAALLPIAGVWAQAEWLHKVLVLTALPVSGYAVFIRGVHFRDPLFVFLVTLGLTLLAASAFIEALHDVETLMTGAGAFIVAAGHAWRWRSHNRAQERQETSQAT